jgi:hypothetical protein
MGEFQVILAVRDERVICPGSSVRLIYGWGGIVPFMVHTRRIRERVYLNKVKIEIE